MIRDTTEEIQAWHELSVFHTQVLSTPWFVERQTKERLLEEAKGRENEDDNRHRRKRHQRNVSGEKENERRAVTRKRDTRNGKGGKGDSRGGRRRRDDNAMGEHDGPTTTVTKERKRKQSGNKERSEGRKI